jgi:hypothetical protein
MLKKSVMAALFFALSATLTTLFSEETPKTLTQTAQQPAKSSLTQKSEPSGFTVPKLMQTLKTVFDGKPPVSASTPAPVPVPTPAPARAPAPVPASTPMPEARVEELRVQAVAPTPERPPQPVLPAPAPEAIMAPPDAILSYPQSAWRNSKYEVFQWEAMTDAFDAPILIVDTASYAIQSRILKRIAFFVERSGARGQLFTDQLLAHRADWHAHDYQSSDLAAFFNRAVQMRFSLSPEELEFRSILIKTGIIQQKEHGFTNGKGAIISISREAPNALRAQHLVHEGFHALFFLDANFRTFSYRRYAQLTPRVKRFLLTYFGRLGYDTSYQFLMVNEFMAYVLQQPLAETEQFFGAPVLNAVRQQMEIRSAQDILTAFQDEAVAFSAYVRQRWGFTAGRITEQPASAAITDTLPATYTVQRGDTLASIASKPGIYWDARLWWVIYRANRERIASPDSIRPNTTLTIPSSQGEARAGAWNADTTYPNPF